MTARPSGAREHWKAVIFINNNIYYYCEELSARSRQLITQIFCITCVKKTAARIRSYRLLSPFLVVHVHPCFPTSSLLPGMSYCSDGFGFRRRPYAKDVSFNFNLVSNEFDSHWLSLIYLLSICRSVPKSKSQSQKYLIPTRPQYSMHKSETSTHSSKEKATQKGESR